MQVRMAHTAKQRAKDCIEQPAALETATILRIRKEPQSAAARSSPARAQHSRRP